LKFADIKKIVMKKENNREQMRKKIEEKRIFEK
jgi:hypothetical protein